MFSKTNAELQQAILLHSTSKDLKFKQLDHGFGTKDEKTLKTFLKWFTAHNLTTLAQTT